MNHVWKKRLAGVLLLLAVPVVALAAPAEIDVQAEQLEISPTTGQATFTGNVRVKQGPLTMLAGKLDVFYADQNNKEVEKKQAGQKSAPKKSPTKGVQKVVASNKVEIVWDAGKATGNKAVYTPENNQVHLSGNVVMARGGNTITGENLFYDLTTGQLKLDAGKGERVRAKLAPATQ